MIQGIEELVVMANAEAVLAELELELAALRALGKFPTEAQEEIQRIIVVGSFGSRLFDLR